MLSRHARAFQRGQNDHLKPPSEDPMTRARKSCPSKAIRTNVISNHGNCAFRSSKKLAGLWLNAATISTDIDTIQSVFSGRLLSLLHLWLLRLLAA